MTETAEFWQEHSERFLEMAFSTERRERVTHPDGYGKRTGECGDTIEIFLTARDGMIEFVSYEIDGCMNTNACSAAIGKLVEGKSLEEGWELKPEAVVEYLESLPEHETHCAELACGAFYLALREAQSGRKTASQE